MKAFRIPMLICAMCFVALPVYATSSRVASLGGGDDYFEDVNNVLRWYGSLASYGGTALFEFGETEAYPGYYPRRAATVLAELGPDAAWGVGGLFVFGNDPDDVMRLAWGKSLGSVNLGFQWRLNWNNQTRYFQQAETSGTYHSMDQTFGVGGRIEIGAKTYLDTALDLTQTERDIDSRIGVRYDAGYDLDTYSGRVRLFHGVSDQTALVPFIEYRRDLHPEYDEDFNDIVERDLRQFGIGMGWNHLPDSDSMLVGSVTYRRFEDDRVQPRPLGPPHAVSMTTNHYTLRFGLERRMLSWLSLRAGVWQVLSNLDKSVKLDPDSEWVVEAYGTEALDLSLGLAVHVGALDADLVFNDNAPFTIPSFLADTSGANGITWNKITLQYVF